MPTKSEPTWTDSQLTYEENSSLCYTGLKPSYVTGILVRLLQAHFYDENNIVDTKLRVYRWDEDIDNSRILIIPSYKFEHSTVGNRPAITVSRGSFNTQEFALGNKATPHIETNGNFEGTDYYILLTGTHEIHSIGQSAMEADRLSEEIFYRMLEYYPAIKNDLNFSDFKPTLVGGLNKLEESDKHYIATIRISWSYMHKWTLKAIAPVFKKAGLYDNIFTEL